MHLTNAYNFLQTAIHVATTKVSPSVTEVRTRMLHWMDPQLNSKMLGFLSKCHQADVNSLFKHFKSAHGFCSGKTLCLVSGQPCCSQVYGTFSGFIKHLKAHNVQWSDPGKGTSTTEDVALNNLEDFPSAITPSDSILVNKGLIDNSSWTY